MTDKTTPLADDNTQDKTLEQTHSDLENNDNDTDRGEAVEDRQMMFEQTYSRVMNEFGKACEKEGITVAIAIAIHPSDDCPMVFYRAPHIVEAGALMAAVLREIKSDVTASLNTEPQ